MALEKCLRAMTRLGVEAIYFIGDAVGYLPGENNVLELLRASKVRCQKGNHEAMVLGALRVTEEEDRVSGITQASRRISPEYLEFIRQWPASQTISADGKKILFVHGSPSDILEGYLYPKGDFSFLSASPYDAIFVGHTHYPFTFKQGHRILVNVGSCGLPRDHGNLASFAVYDTRQHRPEIFRLQFDSDEMIRRFGHARISGDVIACFRRSAQNTTGKLIR